ncbi:zinc finger protein 518B [Notolabrus celidotus]|uniref:zinc finger protein 518B n=1 Tax=Notolabrus celidotus TaxID=1203425 RepID=UPI0014902225|nr:zinc finger protein 518B [Notolabrus celidotus]
MLGTEHQISSVNMKPVNYHSMSPSVNGGHPSLALDRVLNTSNVMCCEKCGFATTDLAVFRKHRLEHMETRFYCFYCNNVSFSKAELNIHLKQHTATHPFSCPHCGQGYMRKLCLVKHIERLHSKSISQGAAKPGTTNIPHVSVSGALPSVPTADPSSLRPTVRVTVPRPSAPAVRLNRGEQRGKTLDNNTSHASNGKAELLPPFNGLIQQNRALTLSLPEEVNIPAGCLVEFVEVRTVNGTKELKLRLVSQQESESVIKDTRTTVSENTPLGRPLPSTFSHPITAKSVSLGTCTVNRKSYEMKNVNAELPAVVPVKINKNLLGQVSKEKNGLKRPSGEIIDLEGNSIIPNKVPHSIFNSVREGSNGLKFIQREPVKQNAAAPTVTSIRAPNRLPVNLHPENMGACVSQRAAEQRNNLMPLQSKNLPAQRTVELKSVPRDAMMAAKLEPRVRLNHNTALNLKKEAVGMSQQNSKSASPSLSVSSVPVVQLTPMINLCKEKVSGLSLPSSRAKNEPLLMKTPALCNGPSSKISAWTQDVRLKTKDREREVSEPESFPVISSVFSLSQQPEDVQGSIQPLVMAALRGIAMNISSPTTTQDHSKIKNSTDLVKELPTLGHCAQVSTKNGFLTRNSLLTHQTCEPIKIEEPDKGIQPPPALNHIHIKEEKKSIQPSEEKQIQIPDLKPLKDEKPVSKIAVHVNASAESAQQTEKSEHHISSKFLTVSLKRVQVGVWKKSKKGLKLKISKCKTQGPLGGLTDCAVIYPMPLKEDQLVKRPGPNQPVVVLNHPRPRASVQAARVDSLSDTGPPKCQILKMRLSKVMGQKYEVMGCTVGVFS